MTESADHNSLPPEDPRDGNAPDSAPARKLNDAPESTAPRPVAPKPVDTEPVTDESGVDLSDLSDLDSFHTLVDEIKDRLADLADRENELRRREDECTRQQEMLQTLAERLPQDLAGDSATIVPAEAGGAIEAVNAAAAALGERERDLERRASAVEAKRDKLRSIARKLEQRRAELTQRAADIELQEAEIVQRREAVEQLYRQANQTRDRADAGDRELAETRNQLAAREARLGQLTERLETDRQQLREEMRTLESERKKLAELHIEPVEELPIPAAAAVAATIAVESRRTRSLLAIPRENWRRRRVALAAFVGLAAGVLWFLLDRPLYRGIAEVQVNATRGSLKRLAREHADGLLSSDLDRHWSDVESLKTWQAARDRHAITTRLTHPEGRFEIDLESGNPAGVEDLVARAIRAYVDSLNQRPLEEFRSSREIEWSERRTALNGELQRRRERAEELTNKLADMPHAAEREEAQAAFDNTLEQFKAVVAELQRQRTELTALDSRAQPRGEVAPEAILEAYGADAVYQEDLKEFGAEARLYRSELAVAMVLLVDPVGELRKEVQTLKTALVEQRELQPPANVSSVLDQCLTEVEDFDGFLAEFVQGWQQRRETVERLKVDEQVVELVSQQTQALETAGRLTAEARRVLNVLQTRVDSLTESESAGTREMVVVSVLRGDLSRIADRTKVLTDAAAAVDPEQNFRLDAHDRQLRGLRTRLQERQDRIRQSLQAEADREANAAHEERKTQIQQTLRSAEDERQGLMHQLVDNLQSLRTLDERHQEVREATAELNAEKAAIARLEERLADLDSERPVTKRDELNIIGTRVDQPAGQYRLRDTVLAALGTFLVATLILTLWSYGAAREYQVVLEDDEPSVDAG